MLYKANLLSSMFGWKRIEEEKQKLCANQTRLGLIWSKVENKCGLWAQILTVSQLSRKWNFLVQLKIKLMNNFHPKKNWSMPSSNSEMMYGLQERPVSATGAQKIWNLTKCNVKKVASNKSNQMLPRFQNLLNEFFAGFEKNSRPPVYRTGSRLRTGPGKRDTWDSAKPRS